MTAAKQEKHVTEIKELYMEMSEMLKKWVTKNGRDSVRHTGNRTVQRVKDIKDTETGNDCRR